MPLDNDRIHKPVRTLRKFLKRAPKRPNVEQIHDLRTNSRRLEAELEALGLSSKHNERRLLPCLQKIRKRAGKIRDLDVLTGHLLNLHANGEQDCVVELVEAFGLKRAKQANSLHKLVLRYGPRLRRRLKQTSRKLDKVLNEARKPKGESRAAAKAAAKARHFAGDLKIPARLNKANLHPYRLKVKALQYVLELSDRSEQQEFIDKLREVKDAIGEWHDWEELIAVASETLDHGAECKLLAKLKTISEERFERGLSLANQMRSQFVGVKSSEHSRKRPASRVVYTPAVSAAASAIT